MTDLFTYTEDLPIAPTAPVLKVGELARMIQQTVEGFGKVAVEGEVRPFRPSPSGHIYLELKEGDALLNAIIWRTTVAKLKVQPQAGMLVVARGRLTTYAPASRYQLIIDQLEHAGLGALMQQLEERKQRLAAAGYFDEARKQPLPFLPQRIGMITSPTGAVIQDMLHRIAERCPRDVLLWPVPVQGEGADAKIAAAIHGMNALPVDKRPDVLIIARGGGSFEDLMPFNSEAVVQAIAASAIPIISGVGHEPDVTLCDLAADFRAPTPTAAAERVVPVRQELLRQLEGTSQWLAHTLQQNLVLAQQQVQMAAHRLPKLASLLTQAKLRVEDWGERLNGTMKNSLKQQHQTLEHRVQLLTTLAPDAPLKRGYTYVKDAQGHVVRSAKTPNSEVTVHFYDGERKATLS